MSDVLQSMNMGQVDGFDITLSALVEYMSPSDAFDDTPEQLAEMMNKIDRGVWFWFCAKVTASKEGIEIGSDYLGCCLYDSLEHFAENDGYYQDMVDCAITEAKETIKKLCS